jgi:hypothetical protein
VPGQLARDKGTDQIRKGFSIHPTNANAMGYLSDELYLDGAQPCWPCSDPSRLCVLVVCYVSFARIYRFLWTLVHLDENSPIWYSAFWKLSWHFSTTAIACRGGYKRNVCRHFVKWIRWPLLSIADLLRPVSKRKQNYWHSTSNNRFRDPLRSIPPTGRCGGDHSEHRNGHRCSLPPIPGSSFSCVKIPTSM